MPSIQVDLPITVSPSDKKVLATRLGNAYARIMLIDLDILTVSIHDLGEGGVWRCHRDGEPTPSALLLCDIRRGRSRETRAELSQELIDIVVGMFDLDPLWAKVEFTQHAGDEMYHPHLGGFNKDWEGDETS